MLPQLPGLNGLVAGGAVQVSPPHNFKPPVGEIKNVQHEPRIRALPTGTSAAQKAGLRYEDRVQKNLIEIFCDLYVPNCSFSWQDDLGKRFCEMDGLILLPTTVVCVEIKSQHMPEAWWQLRKKYEPVLRSYEKVRGKRLLLLEICRSLDAATPFPEAYSYVDEIPGFIIRAKDGELGVFQWKL